MISMLIPSRGRPANLRRLLQSVFDCAHGPVEVIVRLDADDFDNYADVMRDFNLSRGVVWLQGPRSAGLGAMCNECYHAAQGNILMLCGDDAIVRTPRFDSIVEQAMPKDGLALVYGDDLLQGVNLATHPFVGRAAIEIMGGNVIPTEYAGGEYGDTHLMDIFVRLARIGHKRLIFVPGLITEHMHYLTGKAPLDDTYSNKHMSLHDSGVVYAELGPLRQSVAASLARIIEEAQA